MTISMHQASVPAFERMLGNLLQWLDKAEAHAKARGFEPDQWLAQRLAPDMLPLVKQVQIACDTAKGAASRLAGDEVPRWDDNESTLADLRRRVQRTVDHVRSVPADRIDGSEEREIVLPMRAGEPLRFAGLAYLQHWALPNFYFHVTLTYALLRQGGVDVGKRDFLGAR